MMLSMKSKNKITRAECIKRAEFWLNKADMLNKVEKYSKNIDKKVSSSRLYLNNDMNNDYSSIFNVATRLNKEKPEKHDWYGWLDYLVNRLTNALLKKIPPLFNIPKENFYCDEDIINGYIYFGCKGNVFSGVDLIFRSGGLTYGGDYTDNSIAFKYESNTYYLTDIGSPFDSFSDERHYNPNELIEYKRHNSEDYNIKNYSFEDEVNNYIDCYVNTIAQKIKRILDSMTYHIQV